MSDFAVNYSRPLAEWLRQGLLDVDRFKCPSWPHLVKEALALRPAYVHFAYEVGSGALIDLETHQPADLEAAWRLVELTGQPHINLHLTPPLARFADLGSRVDREAQNRVMDALLRDMDAAFTAWQKLTGWGPERWVAENIIGEVQYPAAAALPEVIAGVIERAGCNLLLDISHASISLETFDRSLADYLDGFPLKRLRELHITGVVRVEGAWKDKVAPVASWMVERFAGRLMDHFPMQPADWPAAEWAAGEIRSGRWAEPWVVSYETGGVGPFWEMTAAEPGYADDVRRLREIFRT